jgi:hypothetical protein
MVPQFELICHHTYAGWNGFAVDLSDHDSHGVPQSKPDILFLNDASRAGSGAVGFPQEKSRLRIDTASPAWGKLGGIRVEALVRRGKPKTHAQTVVAGHNSFSVFFRGGVLFASFHCPGKSTYPLQDSDTISPWEHGLGMPVVDVPDDRWVMVSFFHDGFDTMELAVDGVRIARRSGLLATIPPIGPLGLSVGNQPDQDNHFLNGEVDELKIWRRDSHHMEREFFARPTDKAVDDCWDRFFRELAAALDRNPDCRELIGKQLAETLDRLKRAVVAKGPETRERFFHTSDKYFALWRAGKLDHPDMARLFSDWCAWLRLVGVSIADDPGVRALADSDCLRRILAEMSSMDCDPQVAALIDIIARSCGGGTTGRATAG